ncbi:MAG: hypothetical protein HKN92_04060 [Chitinophagales bacterium]|nr:hypothetical protein [Chitinophagales bacterium]
MKQIFTIVLIVLICFNLYSQENRIKVKTQNDIPAHFTTNPLNPKLEGQRIIPRKITLYIFSETKIDGQEYVIVKTGSQKGILSVNEEYRVVKNQFYLVKKEDLVRSTSPVNKKLQISSTSERFYWETLSDIHVYKCNFNSAGLPEAQMGERDWLPEGTGFVTVGKLTQAISNEEETSNDGFYDDGSVSKVENVYIIKLVNYKHEKNLDKAQREILYTKFAQFSIDPYGVQADEDGSDSRPSLTKFYYIKDEILESPYSRKVYEIGKNSIQLSFGALTVPIKMRLGNNKDSNGDPTDNDEDLDFDISTDLSVGPFAGVKWRINKVLPWYFTMGGTFALSFVSINSDVVVPNRVVSPETVAGVTFAITPALFEFDNFQIGTAFGVDLVGKDNNAWIYNKKPWFSLAIGYNFLKPKEGSD